MVKERGIWTATDEGLQAHARYKDPLRFMEDAERLYRKWEKDRSTAPEVNDEEETASALLTVEKAEEMAWDEVRRHLSSMDPYDFQELVAGLLRGMGYHVSHVASPGKDRGVDIIAGSDAVGARSPRIKVQVKREQSKTDAKTLRAFLSVLKGDDVGLFVALGGFTSDAADEARAEQRRISLADAGDLFDLWVGHYEQVPDEDRRRLPIKNVAFLASSDSSL